MQAVEIKDQLKKIRVENKFSQETIAGFLGVHRSTYSYYETGTTMPSLDTLRQLQCIYNISLDYLVNGKEWNSNSSNATASVSDHNPLANLSEEERIIIACFRLLDDENKSKAVEFMKQTLKDSEPEERETENENNPFDETQN